MASPAVISPPHRTLDPNRKGHYTVQLSERITKPGSARGGYTSIKVNHKPVQKGDTRTAHISKSNDGPLMTLEDKDSARPGKYTYKGQRMTSKRSYVLIFDPEKQTCMLEPVAASYAFNLKSTPWESSSARLQDKYPQIPLEREGHNDIGGGTSIGEDTSAEPAENPYDYRNFIAPDRGRDGSRSPSPLTTALNTPELPVVKRPAPATKPKAKPKAKANVPPREPKHKPKPKAKPKSAAMIARDMLSPSPPPDVASQAKPPTVRLDRRASTRPTEEVERDSSPSPSPPPSDNGDFVIDMGDEPQPSRSRGGLGIDFESGPVSMHSVATSASPASQLHTPSRGNDNGDIDFGAGDSDEDAEGEDDDEDAYGEPDVDVPDIDLGPPAHVQRDQEGHAPISKEPEEDDMEDMLMEELLGEEESESEEE